MAAREEPITDENLADFADAIREIARQLALSREDLREIGSLTGTEVAVIREVHRSTRISPTRLAAATGLKRSNVSTAIRSLEARGLLERRTAEGNDRSVELVATQLATENLQRMRSIWSEKLRRVPEPLVTDGVRATSALRDLAKYFASHPA
ncbi:MarR family winged helix-turn-helix transcriptional regulator [Leifsonia sp. A12D58]|uniref:MarR family winged helix-turn-helix transcriptional regulator n=1 Tax=Leifsonia sp. A12D58 TaxID=3397674 RepID=UPI0039E05823